MSDNILLLVAVMYALITILYMNEREEKHQAELAASIYSDCCRNMYDNYGDPDSLYNYYTNIAIEEGINRKSFESYYFCY